MFSLLLFLCISLEVIHFAKGQATAFKGVFMKGDVKFTWTPDNRGTMKRERITVQLQTPPLKTSMNVTKLGTWIQKDILNYTTISIIVQTYFADIPSKYSNWYQKFKIPEVIKAESGKDKEIEIPLDFIPQTGVYDIKNEDENVTLFNVEGKTASSKNESKYIYVTKSVTYPKSITIKIKNVTTEDAGYISTAAAGKSNRNGPGVVLVVEGSPTKPKITGKVDVPVGEDVTLTCESKSTSAPSYYKMLPPLTYTWYRNGSTITGQATNQWNLTVEKRHKYYIITCTSSREEIYSVHSDSFRLNPQYGPDSVVINPGNQATVYIIEGGQFGPFNCSADCNPSCTYQWERQLSDSKYEKLWTGPTFNIDSVNKRDANSYRCRAISKFENTDRSYKDIILHVWYLSEPVININNTNITSTSMTYGEKQRISLSCKVDGFPLPQVSIQRDGKPLSNDKKWSNHTYTFSLELRCIDTGNYSCTGKNNQLIPKQKTLYINVNCSTRLDDASSPLRLLYGSQIGQSISVIVPVISNPKPINPTWRKPANAEIQTEIKQGPVVYRHEIWSKIHIRNQSDFGNYTLFVAGKDIIVITINGEGPPLKPLNFSGISEMQGQINLTWISTFSGGPEQFFLLKQKINSEWQQIENISDIGQGRQMWFVQEVEAGGTYEFMLQSCNRINCSGNVISPAIKAREILTTMKDTISSSSSSTVTISVLSSLGGALFLAIVIVSAVALFRFKRKSQENSPTYSPPEVTYATVDKGNVSIATNTEDIPLKTETNDTGENENIYANTGGAVPKSGKAKPEGPDNPKKKTKPDKKKKTKKTTSTPKNTSRTVNEEGLIYIDVDFAKTPQKTQDSPVIHGEEDRTEYTFVDFSKKAPPIEDTTDDEQNEEKKDDV